MLVSFLNGGQNRWETVDSWDMDVIVLAGFVIAYQDGIHTQLPGWSQVSRGIIREQAAFGIGATCEIQGALEYNCFGFVMKVHAEDVQDAFKIIFDLQGSQDAASMHPI